MTPIMLLDEVKKRFTVLLHDDQEQLESLLRKALATYQEKVGVVRRMRITEIREGGNALPSDFLVRMSVVDANKMHVSTSVWADDGVIEFSLSGRERLPFTMAYLANLSNIDLNTYELPPLSVSILADYLQALIAIPNSERLRRASIAGKLDASDIGTEADLMTRLKEVELEMSSRRAVLPVISVR